MLLGFYFDNCIRPEAYKQALEAVKSAVIEIKQDLAPDEQYKSQRNDLKALMTDAFSIVLLKASRNVYKNLAEGYIEEAFFYLELGIQMSFTQDIVRFD